MRRALLLVFTLTGCVQILGGEHDVIGDENACSDDEDCKAGFGCADDDLCRKKCFQDAECGGTECFSRFCTDPVGTPCDPDANYGLGSCYGYANCEEVN